MENAICGCTLGENQTPFSFKKINDDAGIIYLYGEVFGTASGLYTSKKHINHLLLMLNKAYTFGFQACGNELMPKLMKANSNR